MSVDWIGDKVYVAEDGTGRILEYDLTTNTTREVVDTGGRPVSLSVYPYPGQG